MMLAGIQVLSGLRILGLRLRIDCERDMHTVDLKLSGLVNSRCPPSGKDGTDLVAPC